jgi:hypothetical protein
LRTPADQAKGQDLTALSRIDSGFALTLPAEYQPDRVDGSSTVGIDPLWDEWVQATHGWQAGQHPPQIFDEVRFYRNGKRIITLPVPLPLASKPDPPELSSAPTVSAVPMMPALPRHSIDFHSARWREDRFTFTDAQAVCLQLLWEAWEQGTPELADRTLLNACQSDAGQLRDVFRDHGAWNTWIVPGPKGMHRLAFPDSPSDLDP